MVVSAAGFVTGFFKSLTGLGNDKETQGIAKHWLQAPIDLLKVKSHLEKSIAIFSDNNPFVTFDNHDDFKNNFGSKIIIERGKSHFSGRAGTLELPVALQAIINISK
ncbi:hypothetical protein GW920_01685 [Candidatus Falkowbacteria bacterium]|uniref:Uncharacterized protein n=1 Tax=Candidatus Falkowbacteria bacterium CG10_big_fil_rev_8_21_14_0_10_37_18 TaxID=1974562 RepID=A0A2H0V886_9BACT|nr:hypothetical protein [Candidatus Falkowbacteria bacterium]NCQ12773.1 hypothetical protein [Candidatus Falkowbacteria bacterium]OIO06274.1 MAG: hypothetical protein AUJ26_01100 [Candidatus Falkowbacteria bacterium CG1_02_37_21]PIR95278.1 MAG: hypothetical protein COT93_03440 [Candidatus Falkowbacteria bacterium CG10_big_fil_rev_8_21_14_0_10_37_18]